MFIPGLVSVSFRQRSVEEIIADCVKAGLPLIEWGSDIHVPPTDPANAVKVAEKMEANGLKTAACGSYFRPGVTPVTEFPDYLELCRILNAPTIRVWAGNQWSHQCSDRTPVISALQKCCQMAQEAGITVTLECHPATLTDTMQSAVQLLKEVDHPALKSSWQPCTGLSKKENLQFLQALLPHLSTIHCFYRTPDNLCAPLADGKEDWKEFLALAKEAKGDHPLLLEFFKDDSVEQFFADCEIQKELLKEV